MDRGVDVIERVFAERFAHWGIRLPEDAVRRRQAGHIFEAGWHVGYIWGRQDGEEYLEYLSQHRMTDDFRERIYASGRTETLPAPYSTYLLPQGPLSRAIRRRYPAAHLPRGPLIRARERRAERAYFQDNRRLNDELHALGLLPPEGENIPLLEINEYLRSGGARPSEE